MENNSTFLQILGGARLPSAARVEVRPDPD
jgi:hypothetical protein